MQIPTKLRQKNAIVDFLNKRKPMTKFYSLKNKF